MAKLTLKYVHRFQDRHGKVRHYFRRNGTRTPLPGAVGSQEFMAAYQVALAGQPSPQGVGVSRTVPGTMDALAAAYLASPAFRALRPSTQRVRQNLLKGLREAHGHRPVAGLDRTAIIKLRDKKGDTPAAANSFLKLLRGLLDLAVDLDMRADNPARVVRLLKEAAVGHTMWTDEDINQFRAHWPHGSRARLALSLLLNTGQRRSDVVKLGWQNINEGRLRLRQQKTGMVVDIPLVAALQDELALVPTDRLIFLLTKEGKPFSAPGFTNWFTDCAKAAGLPAGHTPHGLRAACAVRLAEAGCTPHEIGSVTGHTSLSEIQRYTRGASRAGLADAAFKRLAKGG